MKWRRWSYILVPLAAGLVITSLLLDVPTLANPILSLRVDLGTLSIILGVTLSILVALGMAIWEWAGRRCKEQVGVLQAEAAEERRRFLQRLDHELKNPLTAIRAGLANAANGSTETAQQQALDSVEAQVLRLSQLTADLRKLAELEARPLEREPVDVAALLQQTVMLAKEQPDADGRHLGLVLPQAPWPLPAVPGDWDLLFLAMYNLLDNAIKFSRPGDMVEVRAFEDRASIVVEVADTGPGIPREELSRVWEELYRGQETRDVAGSGLGLALVQTIVERHSGQASLRSRVAQGTVVTVRLPLA
jgi:two-component system OmpR family sensor kinase